MEAAHRSFIPAAGRHWRLPLYDPFVTLVGGDRARRELIEQAHIRAGQRLLDVGCGTGSLEVALARLEPGVELVGLDPDSRALERAQGKARRAGVAASFDRGFADALPYPDGSFDRVVSSFMFHHLPGPEKAAMLREARRVLRPGGELHLLDFEARPPGTGGWVARWLASRAVLAENAEDRVLALLLEAGFEDARRTDGGAIAFGLVPFACFRAVAPGRKARDEIAGEGADAPASR
jgi:ubiquinone/menaquinone biosynthesis C-methylase UbiE